MFDDWPYERGSVRLASGDCLLFFTDGITEAANAGEEQFGEERLIELARTLPHRSAQEIRDGILEAVASHCGRRAEDDITLVVATVP